MYESKISANPDTISASLINGSEQISFSFDTRSYGGTIEGLKYVINRLEEGNNFDDGEMCSFIVRSGSKLRMIHIYDNEAMFEFQNKDGFNRIDVPLDNIRESIIELFQLTIANRQN